MKFLAVVVNIFLVITVVAASLLLIADKTASAQYLESVAQSENAYQTLSQLLPNQIVQQADNKNLQEQQQLLNVLQSALTPEYIQSQLASALGQLDSAIKGNGTGVTINLDHITQVAKSQGVKISGDKLKPIVISTDKLQKPAKLVGVAEMAKLITLVFAILLFLGSLFLCFWRRSYVGLGVAFVVIGSINALLLIALFIAPNIAINKIDFSGQVAPFSKLILAIINHIVTDLRLDIGGIALVCLLVGVLLLVFGKHIPGRRQVLAPEHPDVPHQPEPQAQPVHSKPAQMDSIHHPTKPSK